MPIQKSTLPEASNVDLYEVMPTERYGHSALGRGNQPGPTAEMRRRHDLI